MAKQQKHRSRPERVERPVADPEHVAQLVALRPHEDAAARLVTLSGDEMGGQLALIEALGSDPSAGAGQTLAALAVQAGDKELRKAARRALHRVRAAGILVDVPAASIAPAAAGAAQPTRLVEAYGSFVDGVWSRSVWLAFGRPRGGVDVFGLVLNGVVGIKDSTFRDTTRKRFGIQIHEQNEGGITMVELPPEYALSLVSEALALNAESGFSVPTDLQIHRASLGELPAPPESALIHQHVSRGQSLLMPDLVDRSASLLEEDEMHGWSFGYEESIKHAREQRRLRESPILLAGESAEQRQERATTTAVSELFTPPVRRAVRRGLEENAYVFWRTDRERAARTAVAVAFSMDQGSLASNRFARAMVDKSVAMALQLEESGMDPRALRYTPYDRPR